MNSGNCYLHEDLITGILSRLPVKSILRFRSVCKEWKNIITSPNFISQHRHQNENNSTQILVHLQGTVSSKCQDLFSLVSNETSTRHEDSYMLNLPGEIRAIRGPCNGIYCLATRTEKLVLWNPATRRLRPLPKYDPLSNIFRQCNIGFGLDPLTDELKIVLLNYFSNARDVFIWTSSNDSWTERQDESIRVVEYSHSISNARCTRTFSNGFYYWGKYNYNASIFSILAFNMRDEAFKEIEVPQEIVRGAGLSYLERGIDLYNGSLSLLVHNTYKKLIELWVLQVNGCWLNILTVDLPYRDYWIPLGFWEGNKIFVTSYWDYNDVTIVDSYSRHRKLEIENVKGSMIVKSTYTFRYRESLVSVKGKHGAQDYAIQSLECRKLFQKQ